MAKRAKGGRLMDEDTKRRFDGIVELWKDRWQSIANRRKNEWRAAYTLWTALAALIVLILKDDLPAELASRSFAARALLFCLVALFGLALCVIHAAFLVGIGKRHSDDREMAFYYEDELRRLITPGFDEEFIMHFDLKRKREKQKAGPWFKTLLGDWSRPVQFLMTVLLSLLAFTVSALLFLK
jgi:hypothetical protein